MLVTALDALLVPLELIHNNRDSVRKAREAHLIDRAMTLEPRGVNRRNELKISNFFIFPSLSFFVMLYFKTRICNGHLVVVFTFLFYPPKKVCFANRNIGQIHRFFSFLSQF